MAGLGQYYFERTHLKKTKQLISKTQIQSHQKHKTTLASMEILITFAGNLEESLWNI